MLGLIIFIFGLMIGSFLNVCIYRLPKGESLVKPRSYCPDCKKPILWYDNIPLLSYILLKGRCRFCKKKIPFQYFLVELLTGLLFVLLFRRYKLSFDFIFSVVFGCGLIVATFVDIKHRIIPDEVSLGGIFVGFFFNLLRFLFIKPFDYRSILDSFLGILVGGGSIYITGIAFDFIYFRLLKRPPIDGETESMGFGDVKFLAMIGAFLGWQSALLTFLIAPIVGTVFGLFSLIITKRHTIPYGPFLSIAAFVSMLWAKSIINFYLRVWQ
ncbi:MAG: prepilin peptidase [Candidatus Omnitrophica bacterium]|nr:prepilin peptidase [Candidatus Omnitrophota bacterium]